MIAIPRLGGARGGGPCPSPLGREGSALSSSSGGAGRGPIKHEPKASNSLETCFERNPLFDRNVGLESAVNRRRCIVEPQGVTGFTDYIERPGNHNSVARYEPFAGDFECPRD